MPLNRTPNLDKLRAYHAVLDRWNSIHNPEPEDTRWHISKVLQCSNRPVKDGSRSIFMKIKYSDGPKTWMRLDDLRLEDPYLVIDYVLKNQLQHTEGFQWVQRYLDNDPECTQILRAFTATKKNRRNRLSLALKFQGHTKMQLG